MTVRVTINRICDRCQKPFEGKQFEYGGEELPEYNRSKLVLMQETVDNKTGEVTEKVLVSYTDLCETCADRGRVNCSTVDGLKGFG